MTIIWCMVPEMLSVTDQIFILYHFLPFYPPNNPKNQNWTTNENHMMYGSWDIGHNRPIFLLFWTIFCPFTPLTTQKIKLLKKTNKKKNTWRYYHFTQVHYKRQSYDVWFLRYEPCRTEFFVILDCFFALLPL